MSATTAQTTDIATALYDLLDNVEGLRVYPYVADITRPSAVVVGQPTLDFQDQSGGFCKAVWVFPLILVTSRGNDRSAQTEMSKMILDVVTALGGEVPDGFGILSIEPLSARPLSGVAVNGQELPAYELSVRVRA